MEQRAEMRHENDGAYANRPVYAANRRMNVAGEKADFFVRRSPLFVDFLKPGVYRASNAVIL
ncbi:hypothetical protein [Brevibacillus sp. NL20B1]|jgi:hypothetical protein|uniref:hypothetical protein n=1 Tax=Brevibacillus sp. NL20B1 TaxID=2829799 RepID=UPI001BA46A37|nr:hypothetical protein [Brevibacillus sp. NL20B1]